MRAHALADLDHALFRAPYVLLGADNHAVDVVGTLADAQAALAHRDEVASLVGTLVPDALAADIDPADTDADPEAGHAASEDLLAWCDSHGLQWWLRDSGRPGGRHVVALIPPLLRAGFRRLARRSASHHGVAVTVRTTLRLLTAPHRLGLPAPMLAGTLRTPTGPHHLHTLTATTMAAREPCPQHQQSRRPPQIRRREHCSRSEAEFGDALARARADWSTREAWAAANLPGSKAAELGELQWRKWIWSPALTLVDAEHHIPEDHAWQRFQRASPARARHLGRDGWRDQYWIPAQNEAPQSRPRRQYPHRRTASARRAPVSDEQRQRISLISEALHRAAEHALGQADQLRHRIRPNSVLAAVHALAEVLVRRDGSVSLRDWAEDALLDPKTLRKARDVAVDLGLIHRRHAYSGGSSDCDAWALGSAATTALSELETHSPTRWYTPTARPRGHADATRLRTRHLQDRTRWRLRCELTTACASTGDTFAASQHPAAKVLRSLHHQRQWWTSLTPEQREDRRRHRRSVLGRLHRSERSAWLDWLARREMITAAADRTTAGTALPVDEHVLATAPATVHLGMRDAHWRTPRRRPPAHGNQLSLAA